MVKDIFSYAARWDSIGLDCSYCKHFKGPNKWPDIERKSSCGLHHIPLKIELLSSGYKDGEWFCKQYSDNGSTDKQALVEFTKIRPELNENTLYKATYGHSDYFLEFPFQELNKKQKK